MTKEQHERRLVMRSLFRLGLAVPCSACITHGHADECSICGGSMYYEPDEVDAETLGLRQAVSYALELKRRATLKNTMQLRVRNTDVKGDDHAS